MCAQTLARLSECSSSNIQQFTTVVVAGINFELLRDSHFLAAGEETVGKAFSVSSPYVSVNSIFQFVAILVLWAQLMFCGFNPRKCYFR